jgi:hypothetical protein
VSFTAHIEIHHYSSFEVKGKKEKKETGEKKRQWDSA